MQSADPLNWPFFTPAHRELAARVDTWAQRHLSRPDADESGPAVDGACRALAKALGEAGWTRYSVADPAEDTHTGGRFDVRALALIRETLARYDALADFVCAMQGLGSGPISLADRKSVV